MTRNTEIIETSLRQILSDEPADLGSLLVAIQGVKGLPDFHAIGTKTALALLDYIQSQLTKARALSVMKRDSSNPL